MIWFKKEYNIKINQQTETLCSRCYIKLNIKILFLMLCCVKSVQLYPTLWDPMDCSPPGFSICGILQAIIVEWVSISYPRGSSQNQGSNSRLLCLLHWQAGSSPLVPPEKPILLLMRALRYSALLSHLPDEDTVAQIRKSYYHLFVSKLKITFKTKPNGSRVCT